MSTCFVINCHGYFGIEGNARLPLPFVTMGYSLYGLLVLNGYFDIEGGMAFSTLTLKEETHSCHFLLLPWVIVYIEFVQVITVFIRRFVTPPKMGNEEGPPLSSMDNTSNIEFHVIWIVGI